MKSGMTWNPHPIPRQNPPWEHTQRVKSATDPYITQEGFGMNSWWICCVTSVDIFSDAKATWPFKKKPLLKMLHGGWGTYYVGYNEFALRPKH